ncbi:DUF4880 domain-containing protein [Bordetella bronchiseptica]|uniref:DUF4880 domain-containing protein n=1 Tax=Bordetella bronchiseptica TaxID=518 RepID=UPI0009B8D644|nr:DUF4880 domain-containing protein [Bordetella bronchiseptica]
MAREAARWLVRLGSGQASADEIQACDHWRASHAEHERAWQRARRLTSMFDRIPPAVGQAALGRARDRRAMLKSLVALLAAPPAAWAALRGARNSGWLADLRTGTGETRTVALGPGTQLRLNTGTAVSLDDGSGMLSLRLHRGEIYLEADRPCRVLTRGGMIRTQAAHLWLRQDDADGLLGVVAGLAFWQGADNRTHSVAAGQRIAWHDGALQGAAQTLDGSPDWLRGVLRADAMRLDRFLRELSRYRPGTLRCDPRVAGLRLSGVFQLAHTDDILRALPALLPVQLSYVTPYWITVGPRPAGATT